MAVISGGVTIFDVQDGLAGASVILGNETFTFPASADGEITDLSAFSSSLQVFIGTSTSAFENNTATPGAAKWSINENNIVITPAGHDLSVAVNDSTGTITVADAGGSATGFDDAGTLIDAVSIVIPVSVNVAGTIQIYNKIIGLTKAKGGDAKLISVLANRLTMRYEFEANTPLATETNVVLSAIFTNFLSGDAAATWTYAVNTGSALSFASITADEGTVTGTNNSVLTVTPTQFNDTVGNNSSVAYRCTRDGRIDQVTVYRLQDAEGGLVVRVETSDALVFKNNVGMADLHARLYRGSVELTTGLTYQWQKDGVNIVPSVTQPANHGATSARLRVDAQDITDNGSEFISCNITF